MMSVYEYASDMNRTVNQILDLCKKLDIKKTLPFPWDKDIQTEDTAISNKDIKRMKLLAKQFESKTGN